MILDRFSLPRYLKLKKRIYLNMAKFSAALKNIEAKKQVTRKAYSGKAHLELNGEGNIVRVKSNGTTSVARISSDDLLADDWQVTK